MTCKYCGKTIKNENAPVCPHCGGFLQSTSIQQQEETLDVYCFLIGFLCVPLGFLLYVLWNKKSPLRAERTKQGAWTGLILFTLLLIVCLAVLVVSLQSFPPLTN